RNARTERSRARGDLIDARKDARERLVDPLDDCRRGAEVAFEHERLEPNVTDAALLRLEEQRQVRIAEAVDRLHRIADQEQRAAVAALPAAGQKLEQSDLRLRRVLELVDEQVLDSPVEREQKLGRRLDSAERALCREP